MGGEKALCALVGYEVGRMGRGEAGVSFWTAGHWLAVVNSGFRRAVGGWVQGQTESSMDGWMDDDDDERTSGRADERTNKGWVACCCEPT